MRHGRIVDPRCPVNWRHPLNRGRVGWWLRVPNPGWSGGLTFRDVVRGGRKPGDATLTGGPKWFTAGQRPGGFGGLEFDGSDDIATTTYMPSGVATFGCWVRLLADGGYTYFLGTSNSFVGLRVPSGRTPSLCDGAQDILSGASLGTQWGRVIGVFDGTNGTIYINGFQQGQVASSALFNPLNHGAIMLGATGAGSNLQACQVDDVVVWNRVLSAAEIQAEYQQSRLGYPNLLTWLPTRTWFFPEQAAADTFTATGTLLSASSTLAATATHTVPVYTATATLSAASSVLAASATHTTPTYTATAALSASPSILAASGTFVTPVYEATAALSGAISSLGGTATSAPPTSTAIATLAAPASLLSGTATFTAPVYEATASLSGQTSLLVATALSTEPGTHAATAMLLAAGSTLTAVGATTRPTFAATGTLSSPSTTLQAAGQVTAPIRTATATLLAGGATLTATGTTVSPTFGAAAALLARSSLLGKLQRPSPLRGDLVELSYVRGDRVRIQYEVGDVVRF